MNYYFDEWKKALTAFKDSLDKSVKEVRECKDAVLQIRPEYINESHFCRYIHDDNRIILSAPEILIGELDSDGNLKNGSKSAKIVLRGNDIALEGVASDLSGVGQIVSRAAVIKQIAVDPGIDGLEDVVMDVSEITSQARNINILSQSTKDLSQPDKNVDVDVFAPVSAGAESSGILLHSDTNISVDAAASLTNRKKGIENAVSSLEDTKKDLSDEVSKERKQVDELFWQIKDILDEAAELDQSDEGVSSNIVYLSKLHDNLDTLSTSLGRAMDIYFHKVSSLAEACRKLNTFKQMKDNLPKDEDFKKNGTGASVDIKGERISLASKDGDGNVRTTDASSVSVITKSFNVVTDIDGELIDKSSIKLRSQSVLMSTENIKYKDTVKKADGGERAASGDVSIISKNVNVSAVDSEFDKDDAVKEKALTKDSRLSVRMENVVVSSTDTEGKATGKVAVSAKDIEVKAMDVKKDDRSDDRLAQGGTLLLSAEKVFAGSKDADNKTKELQIAADKTGVFGDTTAELQQGDGKALVQLDGGNLSVSGGKTQLFGETTVNGKTSFKADIQAPKAAIDNLEAKTSFKSTNISDGIAIPTPPSVASLSAKLKVQDKK